MKIGEIWKGPTLTMPSGEVVSIYGTKAETICIEDIASTLSKVCRFGGRCNRFYSVAEHCVHVSRHVSRSYALAGLLHDAAETYLIDVPKPMQVMFQGYNELEERILSVVFKRFNVPREVPQQVVEADRYIGLCEFTRLISRNVPLSDGGEDLSNADPNFPFRWWPPSIAHIEFMNRFKELKGDR